MLMYEVRKWNVGEPDETVLVTASHGEALDATQKLVRQGVAAGYRQCEAEHRVWCRECGLCYTDNAREPQICGACGSVRITITRVTKVLGDVR